MVDPGTGCSIFAKEFVNKLNIPVRLSKTVFYFADKRISPLTSLGECTAMISSHGRKVEHVFEILDLDIKANCLLGRDIFNILGSDLILPLPQSRVLDLKPEPDGELELDDKDPTIGPLMDEDKERHMTLMERIQPLLEVNVALPEDTFCNLAYSEVSFNLTKRDPVCVPQYSIPYHLREKVGAKVKDWLKRKRIEERTSSTPYNLPLTVAPKRDEQGNITGVRVCLDLRKLNDIMEGEGFQAIDVNQVLLKYNGAEWFSEVDLSEAYLQLRVKKEHQQYLTFTFANIQYSFVGAPFGAKHLTAFFQKVMNNLFHDCDFVNPYVDNIGRHLKNISNTARQRLRD